MKINVNLPPVSGPMEPLDQRQVVLLTESTNRRLMEFTEKRGMNVSRFLRHLIEQVLDAETK